MQGGGSLDPDIFTPQSVRDSILNIQTSDKQHVGQYPIMASAEIPNYPLSYVEEPFTVNIIDTCADPVITPNVNSY